jgi:cbb3-type cytochrome oxidase maturation protein
MYYLHWTFLVIISLWASVIGFIWALKNGQFSDQNRARYLPLREEETFTRVENPAKLSPEVYVLLAILGMGVTIFALVLIFALGRIKGA